MTFPDPRNPADLDPEDMAALAALTEAEREALRSLTPDDVVELRVMTGQVDPVPCIECGDPIVVGTDVAFRLADDGRILGLVHRWHA